jgi:EAL domain-containing protein (putative c-di-GMP-specific phosphodiesterase class I)
MSVNVAQVQLYDPLFVSYVREVLVETGAPADRLIIEITQDEAIEVDRAGPAVTQLAAMGVRIALDNFGTGHATLAALCAFPVHQLKFDRSLVTGSTESDRAMLRVIIATSEALGVELVAVGVETQAQADTVREAGVHSAQGFLYARPTPSDEMSAWLEGTKSPAPRS